MRLNHLALHVDDLERAEAFYVATLGMEVVTRESLHVSGEWRQLPTDADWGAARAAGIELHMVGLRRDELVIALFEGEREPGMLYLVGVAADEREVADVRERLGDEVDLEVDTQRTLIFVDPFGVRWQLTAAGFRGAGEARGAWIEL